MAKCISNNVSNYGRCNISSKCRIHLNFEHPKEIHQKMFMIFIKIIFHHIQLTHSNSTLFAPSIQWRRDASDKSFGRSTVEAAEIGFSISYAISAQLATFQRVFPSECNWIPIYFRKFQWNERKTVDLAHQL